MALEIEPERKTGMARLINPFMETFGLNRQAAIASFFLIITVLGLTVFWFFYSAPPHKLIITGGPPGSSFETNALQYKEILAAKHVRLEILSSQGSEENLKRLDDPAFHVDIGFVQGGMTNGLAKSKLISLGSINYEPLLIFYRGSNNFALLTDFKNKKLAIGAIGSGSHSMALTLFALNGMPTNGPTLLNLETDVAAKGLLNNSVDAVFLMGDSASPQVMKQLLQADGVHIFNFSQADGYIRRISYLNKLELPMGAIDFGKNIPTNDVYLVGPTVELLARPNLHPALSDLLIEAAREVNGKPSLLKKKGEFPAPLEHDYPISADASRFYKSGKTYLYRSFPFAVASLINRILVAFVPLVVVLIPGLRLIPAIYKWRVRMLIYRRYRLLLAVERELLPTVDSRKRQELLERLESIELSVSKMKVPASFGDQFYGLRGHIETVRNRLLPGK